MAYPVYYPAPRQNIPARAPARPPYVILRVRPRASWWSGVQRLSPPAFLWITGAIGLAAFLFVLAFAALSTYSYYQATGLIVPGVRVGSLRLDGMTPTEAAIALQAAWSLETRIQVTNGMQSQIVSPAQLGLSLDPVQTAQRAHEVGHGGFILSEMGQMLASLTAGWQVTPAVTLDLNAARLGLEALSPQLSQPARDATLRLEGATLVAGPSQIGYTINIEDTLAVLNAAPQAVLENSVLTVIPKPVLPGVTDVTPALAQAQRLLDTPAALQLYDPISDERIQVSVPRETLVTWLKIEAAANGPRLSLDEAQVASYLNQLSGDLGAERYLDAARYSPQVAEALSQGATATVIISHTPTTYLVQEGDTLLKVCWRLGFPYWRIAQANPGIDTDNLAAGTYLTIPSKDDLLPLEVIANKRIVISISQQRLWAYQDGQLIAEHVISTGIDRSPTQPGIFQVQTHEINAYASIWDLYMPHWLGIYEAWPGFMNGIHGLPMLSSGQRLWANVLGRPASYGCIILGLDEAEWLYQWAEDGVVVEIQG